METKNKTTLIIDGNWLLMSRLGVMMGQFAKSLPKEYLEQAKNEIIDFVAQSINKAINFWGPNIDNIIMVQDGGSWRKLVEKPRLFQEEYKGNRTQDIEIAWDYIWDALKSICNAFKENGITCISERYIEGDDWCWYWSRYLNSEGINCIIWSSDADLKQLVQKTDDAFTVWYNDRAGLVIPNDCQHDDMDVLMNFEAIDPFIESITNKTNTISYINPDDIVMSKVICGDAGDNIKSIIRLKKINKSGKNQIVRVSPKEWESIKNSLKIDNLDEFIEKKYTIIKQLLTLKRFKNCTESIEDIGDMFDYNMVLVRLDKTTIPEEYKKAMNKHKDDYKITDLDFLRNNYRVLAKHETGVESLFEDLPF